jgi:hypothetical protein
MYAPLPLPAVELMYNVWTLLDSGCSCPRVFQAVAIAAIQACRPFWVDAFHNGLVKSPKDASTAIKSTIESIVTSFDTFWAGLLDSFTKSRSADVQIAACLAVMDIVRLGATAGANHEHAAIESTCWSVQSMDAKP